MHPTRQDALPAALPHVQEVIRSAHAELTGLLRQRDEVSNRIATVKRTLSAIEALVGESVLDDDLRRLLGHKTPRGENGFTSTCRKILLQSQEAISLRTCRDELVRNFPELAARHKKLTASLRTVLGRLVASGQARSLINKKGERAWQWIGEREEIQTNIPVFNPVLESTEKNDQQRLVSPDS
jgi:hypothetical protein